MNIWMDAYVCVCLHLRKYIYDKFVEICLYECVHGSEQHEHLIVLVLRQLQRSAGVECLAIVAVTATDMSTCTE